VRAYLILTLAVLFSLPALHDAHAQGAKEAWPTLTDDKIVPPPERPGDPSEPIPERPPEIQPVGAKDVAGAPKADKASGVVVAKQTNGATALLIIPRVLLFLPRWAFEAAMLPVRGGLWAYERYQIGERTKNIFFNDDGTFGIFPVAFVETGFGLNAGLRLVDGSLFGGNEALALRVSYGGRFQQIYSASLDSGNRLGPVTLDASLSFAIAPRDQFFGIGNSDEIENYVPPANTLIDATTNDTAVYTRYREAGTRFLLGADVSLGGSFFARGSAGVLQREFDDIDEDDAEDLDESLPLQQVYDHSTLVGYDTDLFTGYAEFELRYDSRLNRSRYVSQAVPSEGWLFAGYTGYAQGLVDDDPTDYWRFGVDFQRNLNIYDFSRILILRLHGEAVVGDSDKIPFIDLARLGGRTLLRGFAIDRFRGKAAVVASAEYQWELSTHLSAFMFADTGRVSRRLSDMELAEFRLGFGGGLQLHSQKSFLARFDLSSSLDGGLFFNVSFDPVYDTRARMERD